MSARNPWNGMRSVLLLALVASGCQTSRALQSGIRVTPVPTVSSPDEEHAPAERAVEGGAPRTTLAPFNADAPAAVADAPASELLLQASEPGWQFHLSPYLWLANRNGFFELGPVAVPLDTPEDAEGLFTYFEAEHERWGFVVDLDLLSTTDRSNSPGGTIKVEEDTIIAELDLKYRPLVGAALEFLAGVRVLDDELKIKFPVLPDADADATQVDPVLGAQGKWALGDGFGFWLRSDIGGFSIDSDFTYQLVGVFSWEFARNWQLTTGYRVLGWEFEADGVQNDVRMSGLLFGLAANF